MSRYDDVIFDLDGTLIDSLAGIHRSLNRALAFYHLPPVGEDAARGAVGHGVMNALRHVVRASAAQNGGDAELWFAQHGEAIAEVYRREYAVGYRGVTVLYPGVYDVLSTLRTHSIRCYAVSNKPEAFCSSILDELGVSSFFQFVAGEDTFAERKPSVVVWRELTKKYALRPGRTLMVGDGKADSEFGSNAGIDVCLVRYGITPANIVDAYAANYRIDNIRDVVDIVLGQ